MPNLNTFINHFRHGFQPTNRFLCQIETTKIYNSIKDQVIATRRRGITGAIEDLFGGLFGEANNDIAFAGDMLARGLLCSAVSVPSRTLATTNQTMYGFSERFPVATEYSPFACKFILPLFGVSNPLVTSLENRVIDQVLPDVLNFTLKNPTTNPLPSFFSAWQNLIQNGTDGPQSGYNLSFPEDYYTTAEIVTFDKQDNATLRYRFNKVYPVSVDACALGWDLENFATLEVTFAYSTWQILPVNRSRLSITIGPLPVIGGTTVTF